jgi:hypothetical protein
VFIKFGDKTEPKVIKERVNSSEKDENEISLDEDDKDNRRIPILKSYKKFTQNKIVTNKK